MPRTRTATPIKQATAEDAATSADNAPGGEIALGELDQSVAFHLRLAQEASFHAFSRRVGASDLSPGRFAALAIIGENPGITQTALGRASGRDKSSLTPVLDDLERRGLVVRERVATDRRSYALALTSEGEAALREFKVHAAAHDRDIDRLAGPEGKTELIRVLRRIAEQLG